MSTASEALVLVPDGILDLASSTFINLLHLACHLIVIVGIGEPTSHGSHDWTWIEQPP
jgi:hypothetical protein